MNDFYDDDNYYENAENSETDTEVVTADTFLKENLNSPDGTDDKKSDNAESEKIAKPKKSEKRKTSSSHKPKRTGADKMTALTEQRGRIMEQQNANRRKGKEIDGQLAEINAKIRSIEIEELEKICVKLNISFPALTDFLAKLPAGKKLSYSDFGDLPPEENKTEG